MVTHPRYRWTPQDCLRSAWFKHTTADHNEIRTEFEKRRKARMASQALPAHALNHDTPFAKRKLSQMVFDPELTHFGFARIKADLLKLKIIFKRQSF